MQILRQIVSDLAGDIKAITHDDRYSYRYLASKFMDKVQYFLRQDAKTRELFRDTSIWERINCMELELVGDCPNCGFIGCTTLKRTKHKVPESYDTSYGGLIKVFTMDFSREIIQINSYTYKDFKNRRYGGNEIYCWIEDEHIYIPDADIEAVPVLIVPKNSVDVDLLNGECIDCITPLDAKINYPDYLIALAKKECMTELLGGPKQVIQDEKGDLNTNIKN